MSLIITSFFTHNGIPVTGLTPTLRIWEITGSTQNLVIGAPNGSVSAVNGVMTEVVDTPSQDGFYKFEFTTGMTYDPNKTYLIRVDGGGAPLSAGERYQVARSDPSLEVSAIAQGVWSAPTAGNNVAGTKGGQLDQIKQDTAAIVLNEVQILQLVDTILKYDTGRTKIDPILKTLTVYDEDCTTPLRTFALFDSLGNPSVTEVCERKPINATDGQPVCP